MPIKYIGRSTTFRGKPLWEILGNLKDFGVGRIVIRNAMQRYPEKSYIRILKVAAVPAPPPDSYEDRKIAILAEKVFRGKKAPEPCQLYSTSYKADYLLVPKDQEHLYTDSQRSEERILPRTLEFPPLLKEFIIRNMKAKKRRVTEADLQLEAQYIKEKRNQNVYRVAEEGETPTVKIEYGLGTPASPQLYANIKKDTASS